MFRITILQQVYEIPAEDQEQARELFLSEIAPELELEVEEIEESEPNLEDERQ